MLWPDSTSRTASCLNSSVYRARVAFIIIFPFADSQLRDTFRGGKIKWHRVYAWRNLSKFAKTLQKGQLVTLEGILRYREVEDDVKGTIFKHRIAEIHAISMKRLSKVEAADDPSDGADDQ